MSYKCPFCKREFAAWHYFLWHVRNCHAIVTTDSAFVCPLCHTRFKTFRGLWMHYMRYSFTDFLHLTLAASLSSNKGSRKVKRLLRELINLTKPEEGSRHDRV